MAKRIVFGAALALVIVGLIAPSASASCPNSKSVSTYNPVTGAFNYWHTTLTGPGTTLVAKIWQPGGPDVTGTCNTTAGNASNSILYFAVTPGDIGLNINISDACVGGTSATCATGQIAVMGTVTKGGQTEFLTTQAPETPGGGVTFDFSTFGNHPFVPMPRPRITSSTKVGTTVNANVTVDAASGGAYEGTAGLITGYNILSKLSGTDPGRNASAYDAGPQLTASSGGAASAPVSVDCTGGSPSLSRRWVVTQLVTPNGPSPTVSAPTQVSCDGSLAEPPGGKYKIVKPKVAPNSKKAN
jgi:hypothetical protein